MTRPVPDKAEVALEYPDKVYIGTFERSSRFDAHLDRAGISLTLHRTGDANVRKSIRMHFHYALFAEILGELAKTVSSIPPDDAAHRDALRDAANALYRALDGGASGEHAQNKRGDAARKDEDDMSQMTPEEEVLLLHVME